MELLAHADTIEDIEPATGFFGHHFGMMDGFAGGTFFNFHYVMSTITWVLFIVLLVVLIRYFWNKRK